MRTWEIHFRESEEHSGENRNGSFSVFINKTYFPERDLFHVTSERSHFSKGTEEIVLYQDLMFKDLKLKVAGMEFLFQSWIWKKKYFVFCTGLHLCIFVLIFFYTLKVLVKVLTEVHLQDEMGLLLWTRDHFHLFRHPLPFSETAYRWNWAV